MQEPMVELIGSLTRKEHGVWRRMFFTVRLHAFRLGVHAGLDLDGDDLIAGGKQKLDFRRRAPPGEDRPVPGAE